MRSVKAEKAFRGLWPVECMLGAVILPYGLVNHEYQRAAPCTAYIQGLAQNLSLLVHPPASPRSSVSPRDTLTTYRLTLTLGRVRIRDESSDACEAGARPPRGRSARVLTTQNVRY